MIRFQRRDVSIDVTARQLAEMARRQAQDELLAIVTHDLRGPLNAIGLPCHALASEQRKVAAPYAVTWNVFGSSCSSKLAGR